MTGTGSAPVDETADIVFAGRPAAGLPRNVQASPVVYSPSNVQEALSV